MKREKKKMLAMEEKEIKEIREEVKIRIFSSFYKIIILYDGYI